MLLELLYIKILLDANHGRAFEDVALAEGDIYRVQSGSTVVTITFGDSSTIEVTTGDSVLGLADAATTNAVATNFHKLDNTESEDLLKRRTIRFYTLRKSRWSY